MRPLESGAYRIDGTAEENNGEQPDVRVPMTPDDWLAERDPQLDKAVEMLVTPSGAVTAAPAE